MTHTDPVTVPSARRRRWLAVVAVMAALAALLTVGSAAPSSAQTWHGKTTCWKYSEACITHGRVVFTRHQVRFRVAYRWSNTWHDIVVIDTQRPSVNPGPEYVIVYAHDDSHDMSHVTRARLTRVGSVQGAIRGHRRHACSAKVHVTRLPHAQVRSFTFPRRCFRTRVHGPVASQMRVMYASTDGPGGDHYYEVSLPENGFSRWFHAG